MLFVSIVVSMEINRRHYFRSDPRIMSFSFAGMFPLRLKNLCFICIRNFEHLLAELSFYYDSHDAWGGTDTTEVNSRFVKVIFFSTERALNCLAPPCDTDARNVDTRVANPVCCRCSSKCADFLLLLVGK